MEDKTNNPTFKCLSSAELARLGKMTRQEINAEIKRLANSAQARFDHAAALQALAGRQTQT